uniref:Uncharacterized protein n=1 Tax=Sarcoptes scabiei TaxID=52283 RepID=A0A834R7U8_SARSC
MWISAIMNTMDDDEDDDDRQHCHHHHHHHHHRVFNIILNHNVIRVHQEKVSQQNSSTLVTSGLIEIQANLSHSGPNLTNDNLYLRKQEKDLEFYIF